MDKSRSILNCEPLVKLSLTPQRVINWANETKGIVKERVCLISGFINYLHAIHKKSKPIKKELRNVKFRIAKLYGKKVYMEITRVHAEFMMLRNVGRPIENIKREKEHCAIRLDLLQLNKKFDDIKELNKHVKKLNEEESMLAFSNNLQGYAQKQVNEHENEIKQLNKKLVSLTINLELVPQNVILDLMNSNIQKIQERIEDLKNQIKDNHINNEILNKLAKCSEHLEKCLQNRKQYKMKKSKDRKKIKESFKAMKSA